MFRIVTMCYGSETPFLGVRNRLIFPSNLSCSLSFMLCSCFKISRWVPLYTVHWRPVLHPRQGGGRGYSGFQLIGIENRKYFMESAGERYLRTSCWRIRNRTSERSERVRFLIQKQRVRKYCTKHFPCGIVFIIYILRHSSFWRPFYFKSFKNAKICRYTLTAKWQRKRSISFLVKTFVKNINDGEDMR